MDFGYIENYCKLSDETKTIIAEETKIMEAVDRERRANSYFQCCKKHVFIAPDFSIVMRLGIVEMIHSDHNVHIFISDDYESLHNGSLNEFMKECFNRTSHIFIHIPMSSKDIKQIVESAIQDSIPYKLFIEHDGKPRVFFYNEGFYMRVDKETNKLNYRLIRKYLILSSVASMHRYSYEFVETLGGFSINERYCRKSELQ